MAIETDAPCSSGESWRPHAAIARLFRLFRAAMQYRIAEHELSALSDRYLRDVGVERARISDVVRAEITRATLLDTGWSPRRRPARR